jgi:hypothetical protein
MRQYIRQIGRHTGQTEHLCWKFVPRPPGFSVITRFAERVRCTYTIKLRIYSIDEIIWPIG